MKGIKLLIPLVFFFTESCKTFHKKNANESFKTGQIKLSDLKNDWFTEEYNRYKPNLNLMDSLKPLKNYNIIIFGGEWCSDTKRELPRMIKILKVIDYQEEKLKIFLLGRDKKCTNCKSYSPEKFNIKFVPTIILLKEDIEVGRIVESPSETLEKDLLKLITQR